MTSFSELGSVRFKDVCNYRHQLRMGQCKKSHGVLRIYIGPSKKLDKEPLVLKKVLVCFFNNGPSKEKFWHCNLIFRACWFMDCWYDLICGACWCTDCRHDLFSMHVGVWTMSISMISFWTQKGTRKKTIKKKSEFWKTQYNYN